MERKKKVEKKVERPELPKRLYARQIRFQRDFPPYEYYYKLTYETDLNGVPGGKKNVGEYVLVEQGTTQTILEIEEED